MKALTMTLLALCYLLTKQPAHAQIAPYITYTNLQCPASDNLFGSVEIIWAVRSQDPDNIGVFVKTYRPPNYAITDYTLYAALRSGDQTATWVQTNADYDFIMYANLDNDFHYYYPGVIFLAG